MEIVSEIIMKPISEVKPYEKNPRKNSKTVELLCKAIPVVGFNVPLVLDEDGVIVKGHARYMAALQLGMTEVPCVISHADPESIKADRIADNKVFEFSTWISEELMHEVDMLDLDAGLDLSDFGFVLDTGDDFEFEADEEDDEPVSEEERRRRYEEFMARAEAEEADMQIVTEADVYRAKERQGEEVKPQASYYAVVCEKCGHTMFVREGDEMVWE